MNQPEAHLLVVDDDERIRDLLQKYLIRNGFLVSRARDTTHARRVLSGLDFDMIILDVMMPGDDGIAFTRALREKSDVPILLLTAKGETQNRIDGLEAGADDYLSKPFEPKELLLRINAILRRTPIEKPPSALSVLNFGDLHYDRARSELWHGESLVRLTSNEAALMRIFSAQPNKSVSRERLLDELGSKETQGRSIDVQITRLRRKIEKDPREPRYLQTVRGEGYMLQPD